MTAIPPRWTEQKDIPYGRRIAAASSIPNDLRELPIWCAWKLKPQAEGRKPGKTPVSARDGSTTWSKPGFCVGLDEAIAYAQARGDLSGIGIILTRDHGLIGGDLDDAIDDDGQPTELAAKLIAEAGTYAEVSPGLKGYRFIARGTFGGFTGNDKTQHVELYEDGRFLTITGRHVESTPFDVVDRDLSAMGRRFFPGKGQKKTNDHGRHDPLTDAELRDLMQHVPNRDESYDDWLKIGAALHDATSGGGYELWVSWSATSQKHDDSEMPRKWASFRAGGGATVGTLIRLAKQNGWRSEAYSAPSGDTTPESGWPRPLDIFGNLEPVPFPLHCMPSVIADFASDQAELMGGDPGVLALAALAVIAGCCDDRVTIQPKRHDPTWTESARIWFAAVGDPSSMKSPLLKKAMGPAFKHEADWQKDNARKMDDYNRRSREWKKAGEEGKPPSMPILNRLVLSDVTVEKMADILSRGDPRGVIVFRDELSGWLESMDAYKNGGGKDRAAWLEAFNGGPLSVDRVNRGSTHVANWSASVIGGIQPSVVQAYASATNHDGMLQRFVLYYAQPAAMGQDRAPDRQAKQAFWQTIATVLDIPESDEPIRLDDHAHAVKDELWERLHRLTAAHPNLFLTAALGKWRGLSARMMLAMHVAECTSEGRNPHAERVRRRTAENVATILWDCLLPHAIKFYQALDPAEDKARQVAGLVLAQGWGRFTVKRDLDRYLRASRGWKPWEVDETCARLDSFAWLKPEPEGRLNERGRPAAYLVNPLVHERFAAIAEGERNRREVVTTLLRGFKP